MTQALLDKASADADAAATTGPRRRRLFSRERRGLLLGVLICLAVGAVTVLPVLFVAASSFNAKNPGAGWDFTLDGWRDVFDSPRTVSSIGYSLLLTIRIPLALAIAFVIAWLLVRVDLPGRRFIETSLWLAFFLPSLPVTLGWILLADSDFGLLNEALLELPFISGPVFSISSIPGIIWVHLSLSTIPIMVILLSPALRQFDASYEEASSVSGAATGGTVRRITIPLLLPAILTALFAGFIKSLEVFEIEQILGTPAGIYVYATRIFDLVTTDPPQYTQAMALGTLFLGLLVVVAVVYQILLKRYGGFATITGRGASFRPRSRSRAAYLLSAAIIFYICIGVFLPLVVLILGSFNKLFGFFFIKEPWTTENWSSVLASPDFGNAVVNSLGVGLGAAAVGTLIYALLGWVLVRAQLRGKAVLNVLIWLPWAIPGVLMGVALLRIFLTVPGVSLLYGTLAPLMIALVIKELPLGTQMLRTSIQQVSGELEEAAASSGSGFVTTFRRITLPLIAPMLVSVFMLVFMTTLRDVSTVVLLAPPDTRTLPLLMFEYANAGRFEAGAVVGVLMTAGALVIVLVAMRLGLKMNPHREG